MIFACPACGATVDIAASVADADARRFHGLLLKLPGKLVHPMINYLTLFRPEKTRLRWSRMVTITEELLPMIKDCRIQHGHADYVVPHDAWASVLTDLVESPPASLRRPLKSNGYLLAVLAARCEKAAARAEEKKIKDTRERAGNKQVGAQRIGEIRRQRTGSQSQTDPEVNNG